MSAFLVKLPSLSPTMEKGEIVEWKVKAGDSIESGQVIAAIATDKSTVDYESLDEGYIKKIIITSGEANVGDIIAVMTEEKDDSWEDFLAEKLEEEKNSKKQEENEEEAPEEEVASSTQPATTAASTTLSVDLIPTVEPPKNIPQPSKAFDESKKVKASPVVKKIAKERSINLNAVEPKTTGSRIVLKDIEDLPDGYGMALSTRSTGLIGYVNRAEKPFTDFKMSQMRQAITNRMVQATTGVPSFYLTVSVAMDRLLDMRKQLNSMEATRISINDFIVKASALALRDFPDINSAYQGDFIRRFNDCDISVAVSIPDGLITPIVRSCDTKGLISISNEVKTLVGKAKSNTLSLDEYQGGSFTISNLGMFGIDSFTAILNPPQSAIMAVGGISELAKFSNGEWKNINICKLTLTSDHRVIDGTLAAEFMNAVKNYLENPVKLVL